jgi:hypothetical protein
MRNRVLRAFALCVLFGLSSAVSAGDDKETPLTGPGTYKEWRDVDEVEVVEVFKLSDFQRIAVVTFDTKGAPLPPQRDDDGEKNDSYDHVVAALRKAHEPFLEGLEKKTKMKVGESVKKGEPAALVMTLKVLELNPGNRAARVWVGFGAGTAGAKVTGDVKDSRTGKVLMRFTHERRAGAGLLGGSDEKMMHRSLKAVAEDVGNALKGF